MKKSFDLASLVALVKSGRREAESELILATQDRIFKFCLALTSNRSVAEDIFQETYFKALKNIRKLNENDRFVSWLFQIARHVYVDQFRGKKNQAHDDLTKIPDPVSEAPSSDVLVALKETLSVLSEEERVTLLLVELEGHSYMEAAQILGLREEGVRSRLRRIRKLLEVRGK